MSTTKSTATITLLAASATTSAAKSNVIATQQTQLVVTHDVHPNKNKECNTFDTSDIAIDNTDNSGSSWVSKKEDKDMSDIGILIVSCDDNQECLKDGSSSLGGRCTSSSITDNTEPSYTTPIIKNQQSVDNPSSSKLNKLIKSSTQSTTRNLQSYTFNCPATCPTGFCNCIESSFSGDDFPNSQCGWHINEVCTSNNGTQLTDDCGLADSSYLNFIKDGVCPYAGCLLDVQSGEKLLEECECDYYSDYCELYDVYCSVAACCDAASVSEKMQCLPKSKKEEEEKEEEEKDEDTEETFATRPPLSQEDTEPCDGVITFIDLDATVNEDNGNQDLVVRYEIGNTCGHEVNLLAADCETEISGVDITPSDPVEVADGDETELTFVYSIDGNGIEESNVWNAGSEQVEVCVSFTLLNENGEPMSTENRKVGLQKVVESTPVETTEEDSSAGVSTEETTTTKETISTEISTEETSNVLEEVGNNGEPADVFPLGQCLGDCDNDEECQPGLVCMQRDGGENVPGCEGEDDTSTDYCYLPTTSEETEEVVATEEPTTSSPVSSPPTTASPISNAPTTASPVSNTPTSAVPTTDSPVTDAPVIPLPQRTGEPTEAVDLEEEEYDPTLGFGGSSMSMAPSPATDFVASSVTNKPTIDEAISLIPVRDDDETKSPVSSSGSKNESSGKAGKAALFGKSSKTLSYSKQSSKATKKKGSKTTSKATKKGGKGSKHHKNKWSLHALERTHDVSSSHSNSAKWCVAVVLSAVLVWMNAC